MRTVWKYTWRFALIASSGMFLVAFNQAGPLAGGSDSYRAGGALVFAAVSGLSAAAFGAVVGGVVALTRRRRGA